MIYSIARLGAAAALLASIAAPALSAPLLSELFYDAVGSDDGLVFVEISGAPGTSLDGLFLEGINGSDGSVTVTLALGGAIGSDGLFVVADALSGGGSLVPGADLVLEFDFQNGPDSVRLLGAAGVLDALGYGSFGTGDVFAGEGTPAADAPAGSSLARPFADLDTDDNAADFAVADPPTPGQASFAAVPEPSTLALLAAGLLGLAGAGRRR